MNQGCIEAGATQPRVRRTGSQAKLAWLSDTCVDGSWMLQVAPRQWLPFPSTGNYAPNYRFLPNYSYALSRVTCGSTRYVTESRKHGKIVLMSGEYVMCYEPVC